MISTWRNKVGRADQVALTPKKRGPKPDGSALIRFDAPQWAPTPGQYLVLYDGDVCLGGAVITAPTSHDLDVPATVSDLASTP